MIYMANPSTGRICDAMHTTALGCIVTPRQGNRLPAGVLWCADNNCGPGRNGEPGTGYPGDEAYLTFLRGLIDQEDADPCDPDQSGCLFAVAPDVVADAAATLHREATGRMLGWIRSIGLPVAFVAQDGQEHLPLPWDDTDALFIGGSTSWKLGPAARRLAGEAKTRGKWLHMGRVNSLRRLRYAASIGCDSADGTHLTRGPDKNLPVILGWLRDVNGQGTLWAA